MTVIVSKTRPWLFVCCSCSEHDKVQRQRQRQEAAEARLAEQEAESAARQRKAARSDAVSAYKTLLAEVVRDGSASFQTWQPKLVKDPLVCLSGARGGRVASGRGGGGWYVYMRRSLPHGRSRWPAATVCAYKTLLIEGVQTRSFQARQPKRGRR
jgi:hypothetical protein